MLPVTKLKTWTKLLIFTILQGIVPKEKTEHSREAMVQKIYYIKHWKGFIYWKSSYSMSAICANYIRLNFRSNRRCCTVFSEMDGT